MKFNLKQSGVISFKVIHPMTNRDILHAILSEFETKRIKLSSDKRTALKSYVKGLDNDNMFIDPCGEMMELSFGFDDENETALMIGIGVFVVIGIPILNYLIQ